MLNNYILSQLNHTRPIELIDKINSENSVNYKGILFKLKISNHIYIK